MRVHVSIEIACFDNAKRSTVFSTIVDFFKLKVYEYNNSIKSRYGVYLKPVHIVTKSTTRGKRVYIYYGKYWYRIERRGSRIRWIYIGSKKPYEDMPDPPLNPLEMIEIREESGRVCIYAKVQELNDEVRSFINELVSYIERCIGEQ